VAFAIKEAGFYVLRAEILNTDHFASLDVQVEKAP
jgi:hypothetical protein